MNAACSCSIAGGACDYHRDALPSDFERAFQELHLAVAHALKEAADPPMFYRDVDRSVDYAAAQLQAQSTRMVEHLTAPMPKPLPVDPLDVEYDGVTLRNLLHTDEVVSRETFGAFHRHFTPVQRAAVSAHWSAELRAKVSASTAAAVQRERNLVTIDLED